MVKNTIKQKRTICMAVYLYPHEKDIIDKSSKIKSLTSSSYIRMVALEGSRETIKKNKEDLS